MTSRNRITFGPCRPASSEHRAAWLGLASSPERRKTEPRCDIDNMTADPYATPPKPPYLALEIEAGARHLDDDDDQGSGEYGSSGTPGSPSKRGGPTLWTKNDDDDGAAGCASGGAADKENDTSVLTQVTQATQVQAPVYGAAAPMSFKRTKQKSGRGGMWASLLCCGRPESENEQQPRRQVQKKTNKKKHLATNTSPFLCESTPLTASDLSGETSALVARSVTRQPSTPGGRVPRRCQSLYFRTHGFFSPRTPVSLRSLIQLFPYTYIRNSQHPRKVEKVASPFQLPPTPHPKKKAKGTKRLSADFE